MGFETLHDATPEAIWEALRSHVKAGRKRTTSVEEADGSVLAADIRTSVDFPPFDRAIMDGYAVRTEDFVKGKARLRNIGLIRAGDAPSAGIESGECIRINTGAPMPAGADAVVAGENAAEEADDFTAFKDKPQSGQFVTGRGTLLAEGDLLLRAGSRLTGSSLSALVAAGVTTVEVFSRPRVTLLMTGHELTEPGQELSPGHIYDSNSTLLEEYVRKAGGETAMFGRSSDTTSELRASLELGLANDVLCVTGGMSRGTHDLVPQLLEDLGVEWLVSGARLKPGKPLRIGRSESGSWVVGLPGNPISCAVCFQLFARTILNGLQGAPMDDPPLVNGTLGEDVPGNGERSMYQPAQWSADVKGAIRVSPVMWRGAGDPFAQATANALLHRPPSAPAAPRGATVQFIAVDLPR